MSEFIEYPANAQSLAIRKLLFGKGVNDAWYVVYPVINGKQLICPYYKVWMHMLERCFSDRCRTKNPTYKDCTLAEEWLLFSNFKVWMQTQDWKGKHLDKDILNPDNKHYSAENCIFVSRQLNNLLTDHGLARGPYPQGVTFNRRTGNYQSTCNVNGKSITLGTFNTDDEASIAYNKFKRNLILKTADEQTDARVKDGLTLQANKFKD